MSVDIMSSFCPHVTGMPKCWKNQRYTMLWAFRVVVSCHRYVLATALRRQVSATYIGCLLEFGCFCYGIRDNCYVGVLNFIFRMEEQPVCAYLEKILTKNMELMEKKLVDYIDQRLSKLQEHMDARMALLADLLRSPSSPPPGPALRQWDSGERLSNGER